MQHQGKAQNDCKSFHLDLLFKIGTNLNNKLLFHFELR